MKETSLRQVSLSHLDLVDVSDASKSFLHPFSFALSDISSLGWMELRTTIAKLHFRYDLELLDADMDWHSASKMHTLWQKPPLGVRVTPRVL